MPRRTPALVAGECYHVFNRGVNRCKIFLEAEDYSSFLLRLHHFLIGRRSRRIGAKAPLGGTAILAYCLMPNHFHLVVIPSHDCLSWQMRDLSVSHTKYINLKYGRVGPVFQGQFKAVRVGADDQLAHLTAYLHVNPLRAGLESSLGSWPYTSYLEYVGLRGGTLPSPELVLNLVGGSRPYREMMAQYDARTDTSLARITLED